MALFTDTEFGARFAEALGKIASRPYLNFNVVIEAGDVGLPRSSGIGGCARSQFHRLLKLPITDPNPPSQNWSSLMGWYAQELVGEALREMGYEVRLPATPEHTLTSGHLDFEVRGLDLGDEWVVCDVKQRNCFGERQLIKEGPDDDMYAQMQDYCAKTKRKRALIIVVPHDLSTWKVEVKKYKIEMPEPLVHRIFVEADEEAQKSVQDRAGGLLAAKELGMVVAREFNPGLDRFPCGWCETRTHCLNDDLRTSIEPDLLYVIPKLKRGGVEVAN